MRGLLMALFAFDFPGLGSGTGQPRLASPKAKSTPKTTAKTV